MKHVYIIKVRVVVYNNYANNTRFAYTVNADECAYSNYEEAHNRMLAIINKKIRKNTYHYTYKKNSTIGIWKDDYNYKKFRYYSITKLPLK